MFWAIVIIAGLIAVCAILWVWYRGYTIKDLVGRPPEEVNLPEVVTILSYLHHELIKHRLPLVRTVAGRAIDAVQPNDVDMLKQAVTGLADRPSLTKELEGYLSGLQRAAGTVRLNFWRDPLVRRSRRACRMIQEVADGLGERNQLRPSEHRRLRKADAELDQWFRPRLQALRNTVLLLPLTPETLKEPVRRATQEIANKNAVVDLPELEEPIQVKMLRPDFDLVLRNLVRNALVASASAGEARVAIEIATRLELTGEEAVLLRIHDTDPTILSRDQLYGGKLGRGLNIVTTTLRRYNASISCKKSKREGFAKFMEVRIGRALVEDDGGELLEETDPMARLVPVLASLALLFVALVSTAGFLGLIPDPIPMEPVVVVVDAGPDVPPGPTIEEVRAARDEAVDGVATGRVRAKRLADARTSGIADVRVPSPSEIQVDPRRCREPYSFTDERRLQVECRLVSGSTFFLNSPVLMIKATHKRYDLSRLQIKVEEQVEDAGGTVRSATERCILVGAIPRLSEVRSPFREFLNPKEKVPSAFSRIAIQYADCLEQLRYPIRVRLTLSRIDGTPPTDGNTENTDPLVIDLTLKVGNEEAKDAYPRIANQKTHIKDPQTRTELVKVIARYVARKLEYLDAGGGLPESSHEDLAGALYFGFVRPGFHHAMIRRVRLSSAGETTPPDSFCDLYEEIAGGYAGLRELNASIVYAELFRSAYYTHHARAWILGDIKGAIDQFDTFQSQNGRSTDFVQGARFYMALLLTLGEPPEQTGGIAGSLSPKNVADDPVLRTTAMLRKLKEDSMRKAPRGVDFAYDKVKLLGAHQLLDEEPVFYLGPPASVDDVLCGFYEALPHWVEAMSSNDAQRLFSHCARYVAPVDAGGLLSDADAGTDDSDAGVVEPRPLPVIGGDVRNAMIYIQNFQKMMSATWSCKGGPPGTRRKKL